MQTLDIIEQNLTKDEFISFLKGTIIRYAVQGQEFGCAMNIKRHADKLVEVLEEKRMETQEQQTTLPQIKSFDYTTVDPDEPRVQPKHEFKLGDHVIISKGSIDERTGVIVRLPMDGVDCLSSYVVDLDDKTLGGKPRLMLMVLNVKTHGLLVQETWN